MSKDSKDRTLVVSKVNQGWQRGWSWYFEQQASRLVLGPSEESHHLEAHVSTRSSGPWPLVPLSVVSCEPGTATCCLPRGKTLWWARSAARWLLIGNISHLDQVFANMLSVQFAKIYMHFERLSLTGCQLLCWGMQSRNPELLGSVWLARFLTKKRVFLLSIEGSYWNCICYGNLPSLLRVLPYGKPQLRSVCDQVTSCRDTCATSKWCWWELARDCCPRRGTCLFPSPCKRAEPWGSMCKRICLCYLSYRRNPSSSNMGVCFTFALRRWQWAGLC